MIITKNKYDWTKQHYSKNNGVSLTVPDQTMSLRTILDRHTRGLPLGGNPKEPIYDGEDVDGVDVSKLDLADKQAYIEEKQAELQAIRERVTKDKAEVSKKRQSKEKEALQAMKDALKAELDAERSKNDLA